ncbi:efflux transporter outer membrane subunit [Flavobacterium sp. MAH-1]|uniref:Efflux transporter outer membrane subunit n=1 Tax=Flavobacterium agri TaxID=2743471 RepID=A0A7Y8Y2G6_9FLAO|nr:efflux transporter outer membrane subunit [Flavobacterium agri]NUY81309.1 efflux transporter outer membrane subunit [Flavobacterium agri]NYA71333.1 efflux transporter outer membrane subunit [Flavobacterium agri]
MKSNIIKITIVLVSAFSMQSCFVAKKYERPQVQTDNLYRSDLTAQDSTSLADLSWDKLFTDPTLQGHIKKAIQSNYDMRIAVQTIASAEAYVRQGKAGYYPTLSVTPSWTHQELSKESQLGAFLTDRGTDTYQLAANVSWEADIWGKIRSTKRGAEAQYLQTVAARQAIQTQLVANVASSYFQLLALDAQLKVVDSTLGNRNKSVDVIRELKKAGETNEVGVKQTEAQLYATQLIREDLKNRIVVLENAMSILLGEGPHHIERSNFDTQSVTADVKTGVPALLLRKRPDVIAAEYNLINKFELVNVARSNFYPSLTVTATGGFQSIDIDKLFSANALFANIVSGLTQPIFNQRKIRTQHEVSKANQETAYLQFQQTLLTAGREVSDALQQYQNETNKLEIRAKQLESLQKAASFSDELLQYGMVNYLEVLTAKDQALNTELNYIDNQYQKYNAVITLYKALGGGWQ